MGALDLLNRGDVAGAEVPTKEGLRVAERTFASDDDRAAASLLQLAYVDHQLGKYADAIPLFERARRIREQRYGADHPLTAEIVERMRAMAYDQKQYPQAREYYEQALRVCEKTLDPHDHRIELTANAMGWAGFVLVGR